MLSGVDIKSELSKLRSKTRKEEDQVLREVDRILHESTFNKKNVLDNLKHYSQTFELVNEDEVESSLIFTLSEIKEIAIKYRLRFTDSQQYRFDFPYESVLKIEDFNIIHKKSLKGFKLLGTTKFFREKENKECALLFAPTNLGNYYLMHKWGKELKWYRAITSWPLKNFETLFLTVIMVTAIITLCIPNYHLVLAREIDYWSTYRIGIFFHILIFNMGATAYYTFAFGKNLSVSLWNNNRDF